MLIHPSAATQESDCSGLPARTHAKTYHDTETGHTWRTITQWWYAGTEPVGAEGDIEVDEDGDPTGFTVTQHVVRQGDGAVFHPVLCDRLAG